MPRAAVVVSVAFVPLVSIVESVAVAIVVAVVESVIVATIVVIVVVVVVDAAGEEPGAQRGFLSLDPDAVVAEVAATGAGAGVEGAGAWLHTCWQGLCFF